MSSIQRSKSAPHVAPLQPFLTPRPGDALRGDRPRIRRHNTSLALTDMPASRPRSGYATPRAERAEDPFSLGGFFPPPRPGGDAPAEGEWTWLREDDGLLPREADWRDDEYAPSVDKAEDEHTGEVIRQEDKLGVLSLSTSMFPSIETRFASAYDDRLLTPYEGAAPEDTDALYEAYCGRRKAYSDSLGDGAKAVGTGRLFSPTPAETGLEGERWEGAFSQGLGKLLDMMSL